jgi:hypothetical protein
MTTDGMTMESDATLFLVAVGTAIARRRTDPGERNYRTGLLPRVMTSNRQSK